MNQEVEFFLALVKQTRSNRFFILFLFSRFQRRKKNTITVEGGQRRSARLLALEVQKNENAAHTTLPMDAGQSSINGRTSTRKRGRTEAGKVYEVI